MTIDRDPEHLLRQVRLHTTAEQDERILGDALAAIDRPAALALRTLPRSLRRHWRLATAAVCVVVLLIILPLTLPRTPVEDSSPAREVAIVTQSPENPTPPTPHIEQRSTTHHAMVAPTAPSTDHAVQPGPDREGPDPSEPRLALAAQRAAVHSCDRAAPTEAEKAKTEAEAKQIATMAAAQDVEGLVKLLSVAEFVNKVAAAEHLAKIGDQSALPDLKKLNRSHGNWWIDGESLAVSEHDKSSAAFAWASWSIVHRDLPQEQQIEGLFDLLEGKGPAVPEDITPGTAHFNYGVGKLAGERLETYDDPATAARLRKTKNKAAAISAVKMEVRSMDAEAARARCVRIAQEEDGAGRYGAIQVLGTFGSKAFADLDLLARQGHDQAINVLGYHKQDAPEALKLICWHLTNNSTYNVRLVAIMEFHTVTDRPGMVPALAKALYDPRQEIRGNAAQLLWIVAVQAKSPHHEELEEAMLIARNHPDEDVREHAVKALEALGSKRLDEPLGDPLPIRAKISQPAAGAEPVDGVQVRLRAKQATWKENTRGHLVVDLRNQGTRNLITCPFLYACELEVDGKWYRRPQTTLEVRQRPKLFSPGRQYDNIAINLDEGWEPDVPRNADTPRDAEPERLKLTPGKHTIRVAFTANPAKDTPGKDVRAISNPVEIEIRAQSDEKVDAT
ncbi:MAG: hypothetical protein HQ567_01340 [Candidatus Nealsonbacteria bacterium]|nr:hypothetical protein [Candidatus Nealsonbacteria bacterium]